MKQRLLTMLLIMLLLVQSSGLLLAQDNGDNAGDGQAINQIYLPLVQNGQTGQPADVVDYIITDLNTDQVQAAYSSRTHWTALGTARDVGGVNYGESLILTWSIMPDGTPMNGLQYPGEKVCVSNMKEIYDARFGATAWQPVIEQIFADWGAVSGIVFEREMGPNGTGFDDGAAWPNSGGEVGKRGDIRIGGCALGAFGIYGYAFDPNGGDVKIDTSNVNLLLNSTLRVTIAHEVGHTLGLKHTCPDPFPSVNQPYRALMQAGDTISNIRQYGPQHDDIRGIQRMYGDDNEKPQNRNDSAAQATAFNTLSVNNPISVTNLSLNNLTDQDWFSFPVAANQQVDVAVIPNGQTYPTAQLLDNGLCPTDRDGLPVGTPINSLTLQNLDFEIRDANGTTVIATGNSSGAGLAESLSNVALGATAGTRYIRVFGAGTDDVQLYNLQVTLKGGAAPTSTPTATATNTPVPPTATPTNTPVPPTATPTNTAVPPTPTPTTQACYWIENSASGFFLDINNGNPNPGAYLHVWPKNVPTTANQLWYFNSDGSITSKLNGYLVDIRGANSAPGTQVIVWPRNVRPSNNQLWNQLDQGNGYITIQSRLQNYLLDVQNAQGAVVYTWPQGNPIPNSQRWRLVAAPAATCAADLSRPLASPSQSPAPNANGWNNTDVTVTWNWSDFGGSGLNTAACPASSTSTGQGTITLTATCKDNAGNTSSASYTVKVDKTLPTINGTAGAAGLTAAAVTAEIMAAAGNGRPWFKSDVQVDFTCTDEGVEPAGLETNTVAGATLTNEGAGQAVTNTGECVDLAGNRAIPATVSEINIDKTAPVVACSATPNTLWPPNHKLQDITAAMNVNDPLSGAAGFALLSATSNEPDNGLGDGDTANDIQGWSSGAPDTAGQLRAERGGGNGRIYTLTYQGADVAGNVAVCSTTVTVAHN